MHQNYYFLHQLIQQLALTIKGLELVECYKTKGDELIIGLAGHDKEFFVKAILKPGFSSLCFPEQQAKPKRFFVNYFKELLGKKLQSIRQILNERCFVVEFEEGFQLVFQLFGRRSNVLLFQNEDFIASYRGVSERDKHLPADRILDQSVAFFEAHEGDLKHVFPIFGKHVLQWLDQQGYHELDLKKKWELVQQVVDELEAGKLYVYEENEKPILTLLKPSEEHQAFLDPLQAANAFTFSYLKYQHEKELREKVGKLLRSEQSKLSSYCKKAEAKLEELQKGLGFREKADIIMANLHQIPRGVKEVTLFDFYHNVDVKIALKLDLTPQKNAENFYRKAKNQKIEIETLEKNYLRKAERLEEIEALIAEFESIEEYQELKAWVKENNLLNEKTTEKVEKPFKVFEVDGFVVYIGKNAANNDLLTLKFAHKDDLWLHAKDVSGSHTVIKVPSGKTVPSYTIEKVAAIAAYYSKRKTDSLCPVIVTPKKYVRKRKGAPAGQVVVEKEDIVLVPPGLPNS